MDDDMEDENLQEEVTTVETETITEETTETTTPTAEEVAAEEAAEEAAFGAGFDEDGDAEAEQSAKTDDKEPADDETPTIDATESSGVNATPAGEVEEEIVNLTASQLRNLLSNIDGLQAGNVEMKKEMQKVYGKFGQIQREIKAGGKRAVIGKEQLARVAADYPDLAEALASDLSDLPSGETESPATGTEDETGTITDDRDAALEAENLELKKRLHLTEKHGDWQQIRDDPSLQVWLGTQTSEYRAHFNASTDPDYISQGLDAYKGWKTQSAAHRKTNKNRLVNAITPARSGAAPATKALDDEAAFEAGFNAESG